MYCDIQGGFAGTGNIAVDPQFVRSAVPGRDGNWGTVDDDFGDLRLRVGSACIDAGNNASVPAGITSDLAGNPRFVDVPGVRDPGAVVDIGAYERVAPLADGAFVVDAARPSITITFNSDVLLSSLTAGDLLLINRDSGVPIDCGSNASVTYAPITRTATWAFSILLPDGNYTATLSAGSVLDTTGSPILTVDLKFDFFVLGGDANRDRTVDITDLSILAANWQGSGKVFSQGDLNYDGKVDAADLGILSSHWQQALPPPPAAPVLQPQTPKRTAVRLVAVVP